MGQDTGGVGEVVGGSFEAISVGSWGIKGELGIEGCEIIKNVHELVLEIVTDKWTVGVVAQGRVP